MINTIDQLNRRITLRDFPRRIVSVVPSQTELLSSLGLDEEVVGITKFCIHPEHWFRSKVRVGGTKKLNIEIIRSLNPDLIIANREENTKEDIDALSGDIPVWISDIKTLDDALGMITGIGKIVNREKKSIELANEIRSGFDKLKADGIPTITCIYLIWKNPYMAAGGDTFISDLLERTGFKNLLRMEKRYPELSIKQISEINPQVIFLSSEPFPFKKKDAEELEKLNMGMKIMCVDGEMFSWYGSRLLNSPGYISSLRMRLEKSE